MMRIKYILILLLGVIVSVEAQHYTCAYAQNIRTLRVRYQSEAENPSGSVQRPFLVLENGLVDGSDPNNTLEISFDEMSHDMRMYSYAIRHLDYDWQESSLSSYEYLPS